MISIVLRCDMCGKEVQGQYREPAHSLRRTAKRHGWTRMERTMRSDKRMGPIDLCFDCAVLAAKGATHE